MKHMMIYIFILLQWACAPEPMKAFFSIEGIAEKIVVSDHASQQTLKVQSNTTWKISSISEQSWCTISPAEGEGQASVQLQVEEHSEGGRTAAFRISGNGIATQVIQVQQGKVYMYKEQDEMPIVAWTGIEAENAYTKFLKLKEAGFNTYLGWYDDIATVQHVLHEADRAGVQLIISSPELKTNVQQTVSAIADSPALMGYHLDDEPETSELDEIGSWARKIQAVDSKHPVYVNVYPNWAWGKEQYRSTLQTYLDKVPVPFLSFDNYPIVSIDGNPSVVRPDWYRNLEEVAQAAKKKNIPFWAFVLALSHRLDASHFYQVPTLGELRLQVFSNLAYGAQAIQYFTFHGVYREAETPVYALVKTVNQEIQDLSTVFMHATVQDVWHTGSALPEGTRGISSLPGPIKSIHTGEKGAVVSHLTKDNKDYLIIVNKDYRSTMELKVEADSGVKRMLKNGQTQSAADTPIQVEAGDVVIYTWN